MLTSVAKAAGLGAVSVFLLSTASTLAAAQTAANANQAPSPAGGATVLDPVIVQNATPRPAKRRAAQDRSRARIVGMQASRGSGRGRGGSAKPAPSSGAGRTATETAWGHVNGYVATRSASGTKTDTPLVETPAAISVITQDQIQAQGAQNISQAVRYTAGTSAEQSGADARFDAIYIRGFQADMFLDSLKQITTLGFSWPMIEPYNLERVEILHGPASVLYGQASPGGVVDVVSKRPTDDPYHEVFFSTGSYGRVQGGFDLSGPIDPDKEWLYRITASGLDVGSQVSDTRYERVSVAPAVTWRPDADTRITFLGTYQNDPMAGFFNQLPAGGYGTLFPLPNGQHIPTGLFTGETSNVMKRELVQGGYLAEHSFNNVWTVRQNLRYMDLGSDITTIYPTGVSSTNPYELTRDGFFENERLRTFEVDNQVEAKFALGQVFHTMLFGLDYQTGTFGYSAGGAATAVTPLNVLNPVYEGVVPMTTTGTGQQSFNQLGLYAQDQIKFDHWVALLGVRWDQADSSTQSTMLSGNSTTSSRLSNDAATKRAALLYKFDNGVAPYVQYTESFQPTPGVDFSGNPFKPITGQQEEIGIKYQPNSKSLYTLALFNLLQQNVLTADPAHVGFNVQTGEIRSRGIELEGKTEVTRNLSLLASYTHLDQVITQSNVPYETGRKPYGIPANSAAGWADYTFHGGGFDGFGFAGGVRYLGESTGNIDGPTVLEVPSVTLFDAAVHYDFSSLGTQYKGLFLQVNATNLFDKTYVSSCSDYGCFYGLRRQVIATLRYRW